MKQAENQRCPGRSQRWPHLGTHLWWIYVLVLGAAPSGVAQDQPLSQQELQEALDRLRQQNAEQQELIDSLQRQITDLGETEDAPPSSLEEDLEAALDDALADIDPQEDRPASIDPVPIASQELGGSTLQLLDFSLDSLLAVGTSTEDDDSLQQLQRGSHDPRRRGFTLQEVEVGVVGAVDPYFKAEIYAHMFLDADHSETITELEEAFASTTALPHGLQVNAGLFYTGFGRFNSHPHKWTWQDQPIVNTRILGPDGMRGLGASLGWLVPVSWFSEFTVAVQNADGEQMASFRGGFEDQVDQFGQPIPFKGVSGSPDVHGNTSNLGDMVYSARLENAWDLSDTYSTLVGASAAIGPNVTGDDGCTLLLGADLTLKWLSPRQHRGWPFVSWQTEVMSRNYEADDYVDLGDPTDPTDDLILPSETLEDWGVHSEVLWGFRQNWATGLRAEYSTGAGARLLARDEDPLRDDRFRLSPLLLWQPTEFSRIRLQYNYDRADHLEDDVAHSVWLGLEFLFGAHPSHEY